MKIYITFIYVLYISLINSQQRVWSVSNAHIFLPESSILKKNKIRKIESIDYYLGEGKLSTIWYINSNGKVESIKNIEYLDVTDLDKYIEGENNDSIYIYNSFDFYKYNNGLLDSIIKISWDYPYTKQDTSIICYKYEKGKVKEIISTSKKYKSHDILYYHNDTLKYRITNNYSSNGKHEDVDTTFYNKSRLPLKLHNYDLDPRSYNLCYPKNENDRIKWIYDSKNRLINKVNYNSVDSSLIYKNHLIKNKGKKIKTETILFACHEMNYNKKEYKYFYNLKGLLKKVERKDIKKLIELNYIK